jgi:hypothetical protein
MALIVLKISTDAKCGTCEFKSIRHTDVGTGTELWCDIFKERIKWKRLDRCKHADINRLTETLPGDETHLRTPRLPKKEEA